MSSDFLWPEEKYVQRVNPVQQYIQQAGKFLSIQRGISEEEAQLFVKNTLRDKSVSKFEDPAVLFFERDRNWVRSLRMALCQDTLGLLSKTMKSSFLH